jgi:spoIIIJ-associated protein
MVSQADLEKIKKAVEEFFEKTTFEVEIRILPEKDQSLPVLIETEDPKVLIGEGGQTLSEIQYLLRLMLKKIVSDPIYIDLDINGYKEKKKEYLKELARSTADEVALTRREKTLSPMSAYERRVIHLEIAEREDVVSESIGQEPERRVVIKPAP